MKSNSTQYVPQGGRSGQRVARNQGANDSPIINWAALWSRLWFFCKRIVAEVWYLLSRRQASTTSPKPRTRKQQSTAPVRALAMVHLRKLSFPLLKVTAALVLFFYVMQRDIQFSIQMKAPLGQSTSFTSNLLSPITETMGFAQSVSFGGFNKSSRSSADLAGPVVEDYMERFGKLAQMESAKFAIPASIKMAQAILESGAGQAVAAKTDNNHFGAPMAGQPYESAWRNWREHSLLIVNKFPQLQELGDDYRAWARGLEKVGYSQTSNYANELLEIIDHFHLEQLDDPTI